MAQYATVTHGRKSVGFLGKVKQFFSTQQLQQKHTQHTNYAQQSHVAYYYAPGKPVWKSRRYQNFAEEGYIRNVIANRSIQLIANNAASVKLKLIRHVKGQEVEVKQHPLLELLSRP